MWKYRACLSGLISNNDFLDTNLYRFIKLDAEFTQKNEYSEDLHLVLRIFTGVGYEFNSTVNPDKKK